MEYADNALRTIVMAYRDLEPGMCGPNHKNAANEPFKDIETGDLTCIATFGIYDIIR